MPTGADRSDEELWFKYYRTTGLNTTRARERAKAAVAAYLRSDDYEKDREAAETERAQETMDDFLGVNEWISLMGIDEEWLLDKLQEGKSLDQILAELRRTDAYRKLFPGIVDDKGFRMSEAEYMDRVRSYRDVLKKYGYFNPGQDDPMDYVAWITAGTSAEELDFRFNVYTELQRTGQATIDAFYVYAGIDLSEDDLFRAVVNPQFREEMQSAYDQKVANQKLDYETFIARATEQGLKRAAKTLERMQKLGLLTGEAVSRMMSVDPDFARQMMGALFTGGGPSGETEQLDLSSLEAAFEYAMIGGAAGEQGLTLPTLERIQQLRSAGIDRARAMAGYGQFAQLQGGLAGMAQRSNLADTFDQSMFEEAVFLNTADQARLLRQVTNQEKALGQVSGGFQSRLTDDGRVEQVGRRVS